MNWKKDSKTGTVYRYGDTQLTVNMREYSIHEPNGFGWFGWNIYWGSELIQQRNTKEMATKWAQDWYNN